MRKEYVGKGVFRLVPKHAPIRRITRLAYRNRFSLAEKVAMKTSSDPVVRVMEDDLMAATFVNLDDPATVAGIDYLVTSAEFPTIDAGRMAALLADGTETEAMLASEAA